MWQQRPRETCGPVRGGTFTMQMTQNEWKLQSSAWSIQAYPSLVRASLVISRPSVCRAHLVMRFVWKNDMSSHSGYILEFHQMLRLPRNVPLCFQLAPWFMLLCYSALVASLSYSALSYTILSYFSHLPVLFFELLYPAPLYSPSFYSTLLCPTSFYSTVLYLL